MYGNTSFGNGPSDPELSAEQRKHLRRDLSSVADRTRDLLPPKYVVGSELRNGANGPRATVAVQPPVGGIVSANYSPTEEASIDDAEKQDLAVGLAASAALQVKNAGGDNPSPTAR